MSAAGALGAVLTALDEAGVPHMLAGSFASSLHGAARTTADVDIVIDATGDTIDAVLDHLDPERFYFDRDGARRAVRVRDQFNVIDTTSGWKIDLIVRKDRPFSRVEFDRRKAGEVLGLSVAVATAEDTVLAKLEWAKRGGSERQQRDVVDLLRVQGERLDDDYLDHWARELGVTDLLEQARRTAG